MAGTANAALPNITQAPAPAWDGLPGSAQGFSMVKVGGQVQLQFPAEIKVNSNGGPLTISGSRKDSTVNTMDALQSGVNGVVGSLQYNFDPTHQHWHYLALDRYDLRTHDTSLTLVARDQKTGFCLVQSAQVNPTDCQKGNPNVVGNNAVVETINPGFSDIYDPARDGQYIDVTGLNGTYEFVQWVNYDCRLGDMGPNGHSWAITLNINATAATPTVSVNGATPIWNGYYAGLPTAQKCLTPETTRPTFSGTAQVGSIMSSAPGSWLTRMTTGTNAVFDYQWRRCDSTGWACVDIPGATNASYIPTDADLGHTLRARVTGDFAGTSEQGTPQDSEATPVVADASVTAPPGGGGNTAGGSTGGNNQPKIISLTAAVKSSKAVSVRRLVKSGLHARARCSQACRVSFSLVGRGGVKLAKMNGKLRKAGSKTYTLRLSHKAKKVVSRFHGGTLTLWLFVKSNDGQQQTVSRVLNLRV
ncbi:MAG TPA: lysyl oxidase family protein [Thermoleophilaceae bacterium]|nr:lysyl oxidase family protein [Thermoleophilaceae bacterium]